MLELSPDTQEMKAGEMDYLTIETGGWPRKVHFQRDAIDGIVRDVLENPETGGLLLGRVSGGDEKDDAEHAEVWIERYRRSKAEAMSPFEADDLPAVGVYSSAGLPPFGMTSGIDGLALQIRKLEQQLEAHFFVEGSTGEFEPRGEAFPFRGRVLETTAGSSAPEVPDPPAPKPHRLVADFAPPKRAMFTSLDTSASPEQEEPPSGLRAIWKPLLGATALILAVLGIFFFSSRVQNSGSNSVSEAEPFRPLGLFVDAAAPEWRVTWNQNATPLVNARGVGLFVREGDDQNRIDLSPEDLKTGSYRYKPTGKDVMFRLEVTDAGGRVSAESFRVLRTTPMAAAPPPQNAASGQSPPEATPPPQTAADSSRERTESARIVAPKPIHRVAPVVSSSVRARIRKTVTMDVHVKVDSRGRVTSATTAGRHPGVEAYLAGRAIAAARQWKFAPAKQGGKSVPGTQTIRFSFER